MSEESKEFKHVDEFIDFGSMMIEPPENEDYARWVLNYFRHPAILKNAFKPFMKEHKLFCEYKNKKYRVIGASRLGDVWLTSNFEAENGYEHRICVDECSNWSKD